MLVHLQLHLFNFGASKRRQPMSAKSRPNPLVNDGRLSSCMSGILSWTCITNVLKARQGTDSLYEAESVCAWGLAQPHQLTRPGVWLQSHAGKTASFWPGCVRREATHELHLPYPARWLTTTISSRISIRSLHLDVHSHIHISAY